MDIGLDSNPFPSFPSLAILSSVAFLFIFLCIFFAKSRLSLDWELAPVSAQEKMLGRQLLTLCFCLQRLLGQTLKSQLWSRRSLWLELQLSSFSSVFFCKVSIHGVHALVELLNNGVHLLPEGLAVLGRC